MYRFCADRNYLEQGMYDILGNRLLRYTFSALARNHNPLSGMSFSEMKKWTEEKTALAMYTVLLAKCKISNPAHKVLKYLIVNKKEIFMVALGKIVYLLKK